MLTEQFSAAMSNGVDASGEAIKLSSKLQSLAEAGMPNDEENLGDDLTELMVQLHKLAESRGGSIAGLATGFDKLDRMTTGMRPGELWIVGARPRHGKSVFLLQVAAHVAIDLGLPVLFFSIEMSRDQILQRLMAARTSVPFNLIRDGRLDRDSLKALDYAAMTIGNADLEIVDHAGLTADDIYLRALAAKRRNPKLAAVFVDYIQRLKLDRTGREQRYREVAYASGRLKELSIAIKTPVMTAAQMGRDVPARAVMKNRREHIPRLEDLRESGDLEADADVVIALHQFGVERKEVEEFPGESVFRICKQRNGAQDTWITSFNWRRMSFSEDDVPITAKV